MARNRPGGGGCFFRDDGDGCHNVAEGFRPPGWRSELTPYDAKNPGSVNAAGILYDAKKEAETARI